ncbi:TPA: zf-HC2 domain-containing protein [Candidatus Poribacteria bacterium]|nr:zf-HC2 domain-containing protein [Candidatus Poribacteria bacterium]
MNLNCQKIDNRLVHFLNGELPPPEHNFVDNHLVDCTVCQSEYEQLNNTMAALRHLPQPEPTADLVWRIRSRLEEQQHIEPNMPLFDLITLIFSKITTALKLGPRPVHINYAALFCYLILAIFLIKLTFLPSSSSPPQTEDGFTVNHVAPNQSNKYVTVNPISPNQANRDDITWAQVKMAGLRTSPDLGDKNSIFSERPTILRPIGSQVLHGGSWYEFK